MSKRAASDSAGAAAKKTGKEKVVLAYSGGLDTSVILVWLVEKVSWRAAAGLAVTVRFAYIAFCSFARLRTKLLFF